MLEAFVSCLKSFAVHLKSQEDSQAKVDLDSEQQKFGKFNL